MHSANKWIMNDRSEETASVAVKFMATDKGRNVEPRRPLSDLERATLAVLLTARFRRIRGPPPPGAKSPM
jgi:hypothetical protein